MTISHDYQVLDPKFVATLHNKREPYMFIVWHIEEAFPGLNMTREQLIKAVKLATEWVYGPTGFIEMNFARLDWYLEGLISLFVED